jgi:hypothetical protein
MPRTKAKPIEDAPLPGGEALTALSAQHGVLISQREAALEDIDRRFGLDMPFDRDRLVHLIRSSMVDVAERYLVIGRACIQLKERTPHGEFRALLEEIGIAPRFAAKSMAVAIKFDGSDAKKLVAGRLSASKLLELTAEDDAEIEALAEGGTLAGYTLDEFAGMTTRELKDALRKARRDSEEEIAAREEQLEKKEKRIRDLELKARGLKRKPANERALALLTQLDAAIAAMLEAGDEAKTLIETISEVYAEAGEDMDEQVETRLRHAAETATSLGEGVERLING